jgi:hypothetical protein
MQDSEFKNDASPEPFANDATPPSLQHVDLRKQRMEDAFVVGRGYQAPLNVDFLNKQPRR